MGGWLFGKSSSVNKQTQPAQALRLQSSIQGKPVPVIYGQNRLAGNLIWYGTFRALPVQKSQDGGGGKGGGGGQQGGISYQYLVSMAIAVCEGPIAEVLRGWASKAVYSNVSLLGFTTFFGDYAQAAWGYLTTNYPTQALTYRGLSYLAVTNYNLGENTDIPNFTFEVHSAISDAVAGRPDANPRDVWADWLTNAHYGVGFPAARADLGLTQWSAYCRATGLLISPVLTDQREASAPMIEWLQATNSTARWSNGILTVVPWGDSAVTGNGVTYTPDVTPLYDLTDDDFLANQGGSGSSPIQVTRKRKSEMLNAVRVEYLNRESNYDPVAVDAKDQASIDVYGLRASDLREAHYFCDSNTAVLSATLQLNREQIANIYTFTLPPKYILPDVEDILTLTRDEMGLDRQAVRIFDIQENQDGSLTFQAEEYLGTASAPLYGAQASSGHETNTQVDPGNINSPVLFEPTAELLAGVGLQVWAAISGEDTSLWGGCNVFVSNDDITYRQIGDPIRGPARMGVLTAALPAVTENLVGATIDQDNTLAVDLSESASDLLSGTTNDALALSTACYVDGEFIAYRDATLTSAYNYDLTYLVRGAYGTQVDAAHPIGSNFARLDAGIFKMPFDQSMVGNTIYLKFQSFNIWGGGAQELSDLPAYTYVLRGTALTSFLPDVENVRSNYRDGRNEIWWDEVVDFRTAFYELRVGSSWESGLSFGTVAHPPFTAPGNGTFWVRALAQPLANLTVYSENATSIIISGATIINNVIADWDEKTTGWTGFFTGGIGKGGTDPSAFLRTQSDTDILPIADVLPITDLFDIDGQGGGYYEIPSSHIVDVGRVAACPVTITLRSTGSPVADDMLSRSDFLGAPDFLGAASAAFVEYYAEIAISQDATLDVYAPTDIYSLLDVYEAGIPWGPWQKYSPGTYVGRLFKARVWLGTLDPTTIGFGFEFTFRVDMPDRLDNYEIDIDPVTYPTGYPLVFTPKGATDAAPFVGGPDGVTGSNPSIQVTILDAAASDSVIVSALSLSGVTLKPVNAAGTAVHRTISVLVQGF